MVVLSIYSLPDVLYSKLRTTTISMVERDGTICIEPAADASPNTRSAKRGSAYGCLKQYANPVLMEQEQGAWESAVAGRYANS